jgi:hypothetical protein
MVGLDFLDVLENFVIQTQVSFAEFLTQEELKEIEVKEGKE